MEHVLTSSPFITNLFVKQKTVLNFDTNEDFLFFLLKNTSKLAEIANSLNPIFSKLELLLDSSDIEHVQKVPQHPSPSTKDIQDILNNVKNNKKDLEGGNDSPPRRNKPSRSPRGRECYHSDSSASDREGMDTYSSESEEEGYRRRSPSAKSPKQRTPSGSPSFRASTPPEEEEEERLMFDPADLMQKSTAALQVSEEVMKPHSSLKPPLIAPQPPDPVKSSPRLVLPRQTSSFKSGHLMVVPLTIGSNDRIPISPMPPPLSGGGVPGPGYTTTVGLPTPRQPITAHSKPPHKDPEHNRENLNMTNDMEPDTPGKMYICPHCNKEFKGSGRVRNCKIHVNTVHLKHKPYKCNFCNVRFGYKDYMKRHLIRHHKSLFYSYGTESVLEKYTTYDLGSPGDPDIAT